MRRVKYLILFFLTNFIIYGYHIVRYEKITYKCLNVDQILKLKNNILFGFDFEPDGVIESKHKRIEKAPYNLYIRFTDDHNKYKSIIIEKAIIVGDKYINNLIENKNNIIEFNNRHGIGMTNIPFEKIEIPEKIKYFQLELKMIFIDKEDVKQEETLILKFKKKRIIKYIDIDSILPTV